jgi:hypothetical protein
MKTPSHYTQAIRLTLAATLLLCGPALAETRDAPIPKEVTVSRIHVIVGNETLAATLDDTPAGRDFAAMLPLELSFSDYHSTEKVADLPRVLDTTDAPASYTPKAGDITYYAPWGNLAIFYKPFRSASGLVRLGALEGPIDALLRDGTTPVRIEAAE